MPGRVEEPATRDVVRPTKGVHIPTVVATRGLAVFTHSAWLGECAFSGRWCITYVISHNATNRLWDNTPPHRRSRCNW